jgi:environmental stress-induced protein Ves
MSGIRLLRRADYRRMAWKNGGGITTEIAREPAQGDAFDWRISIAEIAQDGDFSMFPGVDRELMLLDGGGVELVIGIDEPVALTARYQKHAFPGEAPVSCHLLDGPTRDFNVMTRRGAVRAELMARTIVGSMVFFGGSAVTWLIYVANGQIAFKDRPDAPEAHAGDTLVIDVAQDESRGLVLTGHGELVLVKLERT